MILAILHSIVKITFSASQMRQNGRMHMRAVEQSLIRLGLTQNRPAALRCLAVQAYCLRQRALLGQFCVSPIVKSIRQKGDCLDDCAVA